MAWGIYSISTQEEKTTKTSKEPIKIGVITPLTGSSKEHGQNVRKGVELAISKINTSKKNIEVIFQDSQCDPKEGINAYKALKTKGVDIVTGTVCSGVTLAIAPLVEKDEMVMLSSASSHPKISNAGEYIFRVYPSDELDSQAIADFTNNEKVDLISVNNDYGKGIEGNLNKLLGDKVALNEKFSIGETDFKPLLTKIKSSNAKKVVLIGYPQNTIRFLRQAKELDVDKKIIGSTATFTADLFGKDYENFYFTSPDMSPEGRESFVDSFKSKYNTKPKFPAEYGYDSILTLKKALTKNSLNELKSTLNSLSVKGATGNIYFDKNGDRKGLKIKTYKINNSKVDCVLNCQ